MAFNSMVSSLISEKEKINDVLRKLQRSEEQYKVLTESSLTNIAMIRNEAFVFANRRMLESLNYESDDFIGMTVWHIIHSADRIRVKTGFRLWKIMWQGWITLNAGWFPGTGRLSGSS